MTKVIFIRHAETESNLNKIWNGVTDAPLTERGEAQIAATAKRIAELIAEHPVDHFYVSPIGRARKTAAAITDAINMEPLLEDDLREFDLGDWEGRSLKELGEVENLWNTWRENPHFAPPNAESYHSFGQRSVKVAQRLADRHKDETILIVTHGGVVAFALAEWLGDGTDAFGKWAPHNCAIALIELHPNGKWQHLLLNDYKHLPEELIAIE